MQPQDEMLDVQQLRGLSTPELMRRAVDETRTLVKAEVLHARREIESELKSAKRAAICFGAGGLLVLWSVAVLFVALAIALPLRPPFGELAVGGGLLLAGGVLAWLGKRSLPTKPLAQTRERLKKDFRLTREQLQ